MARNRQRVAVIGLDEFENALKQVSAALAGKIQARALLDAANEILVPDAKRRAPRGGTNELAESIEAEIQNSTKTKASVAAGTNIFYGSFVEFGVRAHSVEPKDKKALRIGNDARSSADHPGTSPMPFLRPAFDENEKEINRRVAEKLRDSLKQIGR